jgi:glycosyltransferase involved in cell wall biosynthesis
VVMVGRFFTPKDYVSFVRTTKLVVEKYPDVGFFCIGDGPDRMQAEREAGPLLNKKIFFLGKRNDVQDIIHEFDIGVMLNNTTNGHAEGISNAIMEYMAAGLPVIATNAGGSPELVKDGMSGFLVPPSDPEIVAEKIIFLAENEQKRICMGKKGTEVIQREFSLEDMVCAYLALYENLQL